LDFRGVCRSDGPRVANAIVSRSCIVHETVGVAVYYIVIFYYYLRANKTDLNVCPSVHTSARRKFYSNFDETHKIMHGETPISYTLQQNMSTIRHPGYMIFHLRVAKSAIFFTYFL